MGAAAAAYTLTKSARYCLMFWLPFFFTTGGPNFSPAGAGVVSSLFDIAGGLGAVATGIACDRIYGGAVRHYI